MRRRDFIRTITAFGATACLGMAVPSTASASQARPKLTVYTYESFTADWGPGPQVKKAFEAQCGCELDFVSLTDGVALLNRLKIEGGRTRADVVLGLDTNLTSEARQTGIFAPAGIDTSAVSVPGGYKDDIFVPFDYGYFAIVYDTKAMPNPPKSLHDLVTGDPGQKIVIEDPRTSTPGLGLLLWIRSVYGDKSGEAWKSLSRRVLTVTPGWSEAYGLFTKGEAPMVLSYTTSPAYHLIEEKTDRYRAADFPEGEYLEIEVAGMTKHGSANPLSKQFLSFMISPAFQDGIPQTNWMFLAARLSKPIDPVFDQLVKPAKTLLFPADVVAKNRQAWIAEWLSAMSK